MTDIVSAIILFDSPFPDSAAEGFLSGAAVFENFKFGEPPRTHVQGGIPEAADIADLLTKLDAGAPLASLRLSGTEAAKGLELFLNESPLKTIAALLSPDRLVFHGHGVAAGVQNRLGADFFDVLPTLSLVGEFLLAPGVEGRVLFSALKNPSYKQSQVGRLKAALERLERTLKRDNREPWEKHDCA
ncbi:MAG: hypothetical protein LBR53_04525 [Deltaproteobacteria bacterium]|jgi:hypothetical protein|nr:hypothetical protein [Deltaproteobacteria bacterium]